VPEVLNHGTVGEFLPSIRAEDSNRGRRHHVRPSKDLETARRGGASWGQPVILAADAVRMYRDGHTSLLPARRGGS
jgi:putative RNA 2'-phosphotransferase